MTYSQAHSLFLNYARSDRAYAPESLKKLNDCFDNWIAPHLGQTDPDQISLVQVTALRAAMIDRNLSISRQYGVLMWLKLFLGFCRKYLKLGTLDPAEIKLPKRPAPVVAFLTNDEVETVIGSIPMNTYSGKRLRALVELLLGTGLRISEAIALDRRPFDERQANIPIVGKGGVKRTIFVTERALRWVHVYLAARFDAEPALFVTTGDEPARIARADVSRFFIRLRRQAGITKQLTPHMLRHTYCTNLLYNGVDIRFIRDLAGHRDISTTARYYLGSDDKKLRELVDTRLDYSRPEAPNVA